MDAPTVLGDGELGRVELEPGVIAPAQPKVPEAKVRGPTRDFSAF
jgi:hypothetical protein